MNLHEFTASNGFKIKFRPTTTDIKVFDADGHHIFECTCIESELDKGRIISGSSVNGVPYVMGITRAIDDFLMFLGFDRIQFERQRKNGTFQIKKRKLRNRKIR